MPRASPDSEGALVVADVLEDFTVFQRCMPSRYDACSECEPLDTDTDSDGVIDTFDLNEWIANLNWSFLGCMIPKAICESHRCLLCSW